ncbi:MAG: hypothetical protein HY703_07045, partial [Gemmatimonadetes bacterium]|nr:hypothetical protein [Gemmatimonadota bacterium]
EPGAWQPAFRLWSMLALGLQPGRELRLELEGYDTRAGAEVAATPGWRYGAASLSLRWALQ